MAGQRQDYLERELDRLRAFVAALTERTTPAEMERMLRLALDLQTNLFPLPAAEFLALDTYAQFERLGAGLADEEASARRGRFIELLAHTAGLYAALGREDYAFGARQHALHLALLDEQQAHAESSARLIGLLRTGLHEQDLHAPVRELLQAFDRYWR